MPTKKPLKVKRTSDGMRTEYDFSKGVRGKYAAKYRRGTNLILLEPDLAEAFPDSKAVNRALRAILEAVPQRAKRKTRTA